MPMSNEDIVMIGVKVKSESIILNDTVSKVLASAEYKDLVMNVMTINRNGSVLLSSVDTVLEVDDEIYFVCDMKQVKYCLALFGYEEKESKRFVIIGGGNIGSFLAKEYEDKNVIMIEKDSPQSRKLAEKFLI